MGDLCPNANRGGSEAPIIYWDERGIWGIPAGLTDARLCIPTINILGPWGDSGMGAETGMDMAISVAVALALLRSYYGTARGLTMKVTKQVAFANALKRGTGPDPDDVTLVTRHNDPLGVFVPYSIWFWMQTYVASAIESREAERLSGGRKKS